MTRGDIQLWQDRQTPSLAISGDGGICYLDNLSPNYGRAMYVCKYRGSVAQLETFDGACAWFAWVKDQHKDTPA